VVQKGKQVTDQLQLLLEYQQRVVVRDQVKRIGDLVKVAVLVAVAVLLDVIIIQGVREPVAKAILGEAALLIAPRAVGDGVVAVVALVAPEPLQKILTVLDELVATGYLVLSQEPRLHMLVAEEEGLTTKVAGLVGDPGGLVVAEMAVLLFTLGEEVLVAQIPEVAAVEGAGLTQAAVRPADQV
jgi:hypothetical protein